jgi:hypothetical protein
MKNLSFKNKSHEKKTIINIIVYDLSFAQQDAQFTQYMYNTLISIPPMQDQEE